MPRGRIRIGVLAAVVALVVAAPVASIASATADHYLCYRAGLAKGSLRFPKGVTKTLADRVGTETFGIAGIKTVCTPVDRNGSGVAHPSVHLEGFAIRKQHGAARFVRSDQVVADAF